MFHRIRVVSLYIVVIVLSLFSNLVIKFIKFKYIIGRLAKDESLDLPAETERELILLRRLTKVIDDVSYIVPWRSKCYESALIMLILCKGLNVSITIHFGVCYDETGELAAHAWTARNDINYTGGEENSEFKRVFSRSYMKKS